jgi:hypothetical protein
MPRKHSYSIYAEPFGVIDEMIGLVRCQFRLPIYANERVWLHNATWSLKIDIMSIYNESHLID